MDSTVFLTILILLAPLANAVACYPGATWPKMIGYGNVDSEIISVDRRSDGAKLAFVLNSLEADLVGTGQTAVQTVLTLDLATEAYDWQKVVQNVWVDNPSYVYYTPDTQRLLFLHMHVNGSGNYEKALLYFDASTGATLGSTGYSKIMTMTTAEGFYHKDQLILSNDGSKIYTLHQWPAYGAVTLNAVLFNTGTNTWSDQDEYTWNINHSGFATPEVLRPSLTFGYDETTVLTFSTDTNGGDSKIEMECRMDVWDASNIASGESYNKGSRSDGNEARNCRFPYVLGVSTNEYYVLLISEYYAAYKIGFVRFYLRSTYQEHNNKEQERMWADGTGTYDLRFTSAYYPSIDYFYAMAYNTIDSQNYLVIYWWDDPNLAPDLYAMKGWSEDPTASAAAYAGNAHRDSYIIGLNAGDPDDDFKVTGFMVGATSSIWTYNDCLAPDFGITVTSYQQLWSAPNAGAKMGIAARIELDVTSCNHEFVELINNFGGVTLEDIDEENRNLETNALSGSGDQHQTFTASVLDVSTASASGITVGGWEGSLDMSACAAQSADESFYQMTEALFEGDDIIEYEVGAGLYNVAFIDWLVSDGSCTIDKVYDTLETYNGATTTDLNLVTPTSSDLNVGLLSTDVSIIDRDYVVTVLATTNSYQCVQKDFTVKPFSCTVTSMTGALWFASSLNILDVEYTIGAAAIVESLKFVSSIAACSIFEALVYEKDSGGTWNIHDGSVLTVVKDTSQVLQNGQHIYEATAATSDLSYDPGTGTTGLIVEYKVSIATPDHASANNVPLNPKEFFLTIEFRNECRDLVVDPQIIPFMENIIYEPQVSQTVPEFFFTPALTSCGTQSISIYDDGLGNDYPSFITTSGMDMLLQSSDTAKVGDYYVKVVVAFSAFPMDYRNTYDVLVRLKDSCRDDTFTAATWVSSGSTSIVQYDHVIGYDTENHSYSPAVANTLNSYCTINYFLQEEVSGVWGDYTGALASLSSATQVLTLTSTVADVALDGTTRHFRVAAATVSDLSTATSPLLLDVTVRYIHPCYSAAFSDNGGITTPIVTTVYSPPHPNPQTIAVPDFPYDLQGTIDCGTQTISLSAVTPITPGVEADFISIADVGGAWTLTVAATNAAQETYSFTLQFDVVLDTYTSVTYTSPTTFDVDIQANCNAGTVTGFQWSSNAATSLATQSLYLDGTTISESFTAAPSLAWCSLIYEFQILDSGSASYVTYSGSDVTVNTSSNQMDASSLDGALDRTTDHFKVRAAVTDGGTEVGVYSEITFSIYWTSRCWDVNLVLDHPYDHLNTYVFGPAVSNTRPTIDTYPFPGIDCGDYEWEVIWPIEDRVERITTYSASGSFTTESTEIEDTGTYTIWLNVWLQNFATITTTTSFNVYITECTPSSILPPATPIGEFIHVIGSAQGKRSFLDFTEVPACETVLDYYLLDMQGKELAEAFQVRVYVDDNTNQKLILVETQDFSLVGTYEVQLVAESAFNVTNTQTYSFDLVLLEPDGYEYLENVLIPGVEPGGSLGTLVLTPGVPLSYFLPTAVNQDGIPLETGVFLGGTADFLTFNEGSNSIIYDPANPVRSGSYQIIVTLRDKDEFGVYHETDYVLNVTVPQIVGGVVETLDPELELMTPFELSKATLNPVITDISTLGEATLTWDQDMLLPRNETYFEESLKRSVYIEDPLSGLLYERPAFEVHLDQSYVHQFDLTVDWELMEWVNERELKIQLLFNSPDSVSMEIPADFLNITFWDQSLFMSKAGGLYVPWQHEITAQIPPQMAKGELADVLKGLSGLIQGLTVGTGVASLLLILLINFGLSWLWGLLHAVQLIVHIPLLSVQFPAKAFIFYEGLISIARMDMIDSESVFSRETFGLDPDEGPYSMEFDRLEYGVQNFWLNVDYLLIQVFLSSGLLLLSLVLAVAAKCSRNAQVYSKKINKVLYYNFFLRLLMEMSLELSIASLLDIKVFSTTPERDSTGYTASFCLSIIAIAALIALICFMRFSIRKKYSTLSAEKVKQKIGTVYEGLNLKSKPFSIAWSEWFVLRRMIYAATAVFAIKHLWLQLQLILNSALFTLGLIGSLRPFDQVFTVRYELLNECFFIILVYHVITFSDLVTPGETRSMMGLSCVVFTITAIMSNILVLLGQISASFSLLLKKYFAKSKARKAKKLQQQRLARLQANTGSYKPDLDELERQMNRVEVKAKQTSYLNSLVNRGPQIPTPKVQPSDTLLSNLNQASLEGGPKGSQRRLIEQSASNKSDARTADHSLDLNPHDPALKLLQQSQARNGYRGFNVDLQMFPQDGVKGPKASSKVDLNQIFYGEKGSRNQTPAFNKTSLPSGPVKLIDTQLKPKQKPNDQDDQMSIFENMPAGYGKKLHFTLK